MNLITAKFQHRVHFNLKGGEYQLAALYPLNYAEQELGTCSKVLNKSCAGIRKSEYFVSRVVYTSQLSA